MAGGGPDTRKRTRIVVCYVSGFMILDGNRVRDEIKAELKPRVAALAARGRPPGLAVVLVGHNPASEIYVRNKVKPATISAFTPKP